MSSRWILVGITVALHWMSQPAAASSDQCPQGRTQTWTITALYTGEVFNNARGGLSTRGATRYLGLLDLGIALDPASLDRSIPGTFFLLAQNTQGEGLTEQFIGDRQVISNIDGSRAIMQVSEYWWEFSPGGDSITVRLGKQDFNTEFAFIETAADFIQSTFGLSPSTAFPTYPDQSIGAVILVQLNEQVRLKSGVWDAFGKGSTWGFSGNDSVLVASELEWSYALSAGQLPGVLAIGAIYESAGRIGGQPVSAVHEYIVQFEQVIVREGGEQSQQGLSVFGGYYPRFPGAQTLEESIGDSLVAGLVYRGPVEGRDQDSIGFGAAWTELFQNGSNQETVVELYYRAELASRLRVQPDLQYIATPSGIYRDALAIGFRFQMEW
jgi:porin